MKKITKIFGLFVLFMLTTIFHVYAKQTPTIHLFYGEWCPHCKREIQFLEKRGKETWELTIKKYEIRGNKTNSDLLAQIAKKYNFNVTGVPFTIVGEQTFAWFGTEQTTGRQIQKAVEYCQNNPCKNLVESLWNTTTTTETTTQNTWKERLLHIPFIGNVNTISD